MASDETIKILLIDDDEAEVFLTNAILERIPRSSFALDWVGTFEEGRRALAALEHDLYLVDYKLGEESGIDLVREAREMGNWAPMILLTGKGRYEVDVEAMEAGVSDYLEKGKADPDLMERSIRYSMERARADAELRESEERLRSLFEHLPVGLYRATEDGKLIDANPTLVDILGRPDAKTLRSEYARNFFVSPAHRQSLLHRLSRGTVRGFESELRRSDGDSVKVRTSARAHRTFDGRVQYIEGAVEDVTEERLAKDMHARAARFSWLSDHSGVPVLLLELTGEISTANPAFLAAFGHSAEDTAEKNVLDFIADDDQAALANDIARVASGASDMSAARRRIRTGDGKELTCHVRTGLVRTWDGHPDHLIVLFDDIDAN